MLDDTVSIRSLRLVRDDLGRLRLHRSCYEFEYSDTGDNRRRGSVTLLGHDVVMGQPARPPDAGRWRAP